jgi:hypothetical protein
MAEGRTPDVSDRDVFFGEKGSYDSLLRGKAVEYFGGPQDAPIGQRRWFAYRWWTDGLEQAEALLARTYEVLAELDRWQLARIDRAEGADWFLLGTRPALYVAACYLGQPPEGMSNEQMLSELIRLAERARAV